MWGNAMGSNQSLLNETRRASNARSFDKRATLCSRASGICGGRGGGDPTKSRPIQREQPVALPGTTESSPSSSYSVTMEQMESNAARAKAGDVDCPIISAVDAVCYHLFGNDDLARLTSLSTENPQRIFSVLDNRDHSSRQETPFRNRDVSWKDAVAFVDDDEHRSGEANFRSRDHPVLEEGSGHFTPPPPPPSRRRDDRDGRNIRSNDSADGILEDRTGKPSRATPEVRPAPAPTAIVVEPKSTLDDPNEEHLKRFYDKRTWGMYFRITEARERQKLAMVQPKRSSHHNDALEALVGTAAKEMGGHERSLRSSRWSREEQYDHFGDDDEAEDHVDLDEEYDDDEESHEDDSPIPTFASIKYVDMESPAPSSSHTHGVASRIKHWDAIPPSATNDSDDTDILIFGDIE